MTWRNPRFRGVRRALRLAGAAAALAGAPVLAAEAPKTPPAGDRPKTVSEVVVQPEVAVKGAVIGDIQPDLQLQPADIQAYGVSTINELLSELSAEIGSNAGRGGEGPAILVNGRRISGLNEIRNIPTEAILRVDILPEEAALKYGFTANQRVVNIVLKDHVGADLAVAQGGAATEGGGATGKLEVGRTRINGDRRFNIDLNYTPQASLTEAERHLTSLGAVGGRDGIDVRPFRTLVAESQKVSLNAVVTAPIGFGVQGTINGTLEATSTEGLSGLPRVGLIAPDGTRVDRLTTAFGPLRQDTDAWSGHLGVGLNRDLAGWRLAFTGNYDHGDTLSRNDIGVDAAALQTAVAAGRIDPLGPLPADLLTRLPRDTGRAITDSANAQVVGSGPLLALPAGALRGSFRLGATGSWIGSRSERGGLAQSGGFSQTQTNAQASFDAPITSREKKVLGALGDVVLNANAEVQQVTGFGELTAFGYGLHWTPIQGLSILVSRQHDEAAPSQAQLRTPILATPGSRIFDFVTGQTVDVIRISGGNPLLTKDQRERTSVRINWKPFADRALLLRADFNQVRYKNPITTFPAASAAIEAAFPDRFQRDAGGELTEVDFRPVNFARQEVSSLKWGFDWSMPIGPVRQPPPRSAVFQQLRQAGVAGLVGRRPGAPGGAPASPPLLPPGMEFVPAGPAETAPAPGGLRAGGGFGGRGGPGGPGGRRGVQDGRLHLQVFHTVYFADRFLVRPGGPLIDFLDGSSLNGAGGRAQHEVQAQLNIAERGFGGELTLDWTSGTQVVGAPPTGDLSFSGLTKVNARLFADLSQRKTLIEQQPWLKGVRLSLSVQNLFDERVKVTDATGATPLNFQPAYLDPLGRTWRVEIRKLFASGI